MDNSQNAYKLESDLEKYWEMQTPTFDAARPLEPISYRVCGSDRSSEGDRPQCFLLAASPDPCDQVILATGVMNADIADRLSTVMNACKGVPSMALLRHGVVSDVFASFLTLLSAVEQMQQDYPIADNLLDAVQLRKAQQLRQTITSPELSSMVREVKLLRKRLKDGPALGENLEELRDQLLNLVETLQDVE